MKSLSRDALKKAFLSHFFSPAKNASDLLNKLGAVQIDPLTIVSKNHLLVFSIRNEKFSSDNLSALYKNGKVVEVFAKERCIVPTSDAYLYAERLKSHKDHWWSSRPLKNHPAETKEILSLVKEKGEVASSDFTAKKWSADHSWRSGNIYTSILGALHETGELIIAGRNDRKLTYSLPPKNLWNPPKKMTEEEIRLKRYERYLNGVLVTDIKDSFAGFERSNSGERKKIFERLIELGLAVPLEDEKIFTVISKKAFKQSEKSTSSALPAFIPPLDNSIWNRDFIERLWGLRYRWEIYTPAEKRVFGPYAMPLVTENGFFGPIDFKFERASGKLIGKMSASPIAKANRETKEAAEIAALKLARSIGAEEVELI